VAVCRKPSVSCRKIGDGFGRNAKGTGCLSTRDAPIVKFMADTDV